ncbi:MAG: TVP38/TMEM64 family protein [Oscillibacter sp.]|nr:TVP38/TMEM64 family protein [Oscillibacter sp.]
MSNQSWNANGPQIRKYRVILICVWAAILIFCFLNRDSFTVDGVLAYSPQNTFFAALFMMLLFALKSMSIFIFSGILFAANGILFPLPAAIGLNVLGAGIMVSLPYWIGKKVGKDMIDRIVCRYPKVEVLRNIQTDHEFLLSFVTRVVNVLPSDILSLYMGAVGIGYAKYLAGSILGMLLSIITFPIMGMNIMNPGSPAFIVSVCVQMVISAISIGGFWIYYKKNRV